MITHTDCRHFRPAQPCAPHKLSGARCGCCPQYAPVAERIIIVKLGALGDVLRTTCCLPPLKARHPDSHVTWVTRPEARAMLERNPSIDRVLTIEDGYLEWLLAEVFDIAIGPEADARSASIMKLVACGDKRGFAADGRGGVQPLSEPAREWWLTGIDDPRKRANRQTYGEWLYRVIGLPCPVARPVLDIGDAAAARAGSLLDGPGATWRRGLCINTGGSTRWQEKRWKPEHFRALIRRLSVERPDVRIVLTGGPDEASFNRDLLSSDPAVIDGGVGHSVEEFGAIVARCDWVLTADSLGYHVACAVGTPAVCLVGPTSPWELDRYDANLVLHSDLPCIACYQASCPLPRTCMDELSVERVWPHITGWLSAATARTEPSGGVVPIALGGAAMAIAGELPARLNARPICR